MTADRRVPQPASVADAERISAAWFGGRPRIVRPGPISGFSGTRLAIVELTECGDLFVVKAFRQGASRDRARWVHGFMRRARAAGIHEVPELAVTSGGDTLVEDADGVHWEAVRFVAGTAVTAPRVDQVVVGVELLARLHAAVERLPGTPCGRAVSAGVRRRIEQARRLRTNPWSSLARTTVAARDADAASLVQDVCTRLHRADAVFAAVAGPRVIDSIVAFPCHVHALQPVLRDVWSDHVLFSTVDSANVAGLVDFHAADVDVPATDLARLLGSWLPPADRSMLPVVDRWPEALPAYERIRPLPAGSRDVVNWLEATGVICGLDNWFRWVLQDGRVFPAAAAVLQRVDRLLDGLPAAVQILSKCGKDAGLTPGNCSL